MLTKRDKKHIEDELAKIDKYLKQDVGPGMSNFSEITSHIYITNWAGACNHTYLKDKIIELVICVSKEKKTRDELKVYNRLRIQHVSIPIADDPRENIGIHLDRFYEMMHSSIMEEKNILVHCETGSSASASLVLYYLLRRYYATNFGKRANINQNLISKQFKLKQLINYMKDRRPCVDPNLGFIAQLLTAELILKKKYTTIYEAQLEEQRKEQEREDDESAEEQRKQRSSLFAQLDDLDNIGDEYNDSSEISTKPSKSSKTAKPQSQKTTKPLKQAQKSSLKSAQKSVKHAQKSVRFVDENDSKSDESSDDTANAARKKALERRAKLFGNRASVKNVSKKYNQKDNSDTSDDVSDIKDTYKNDTYKNDVSDDIIDDIDGTDDQTNSEND